MSVRLVPLRYDVYCTECQLWLGLVVGKMQARRAANAHRRSDRARVSVAPLIVHEAKLPGAA